MCRRNFCDKHQIDQEKNPKRKFQQKEPVAAPCSRSSAPRFDFSKNCLFYGQAVKLCKIPSRKFAQAYEVRNNSFDHSISEICKSSNGQWAMTMLGRINSKTSDLHAETAVYHQICSVNFRTGKAISQKLCGQEKIIHVPPPKKLKGRPYDSAGKVALKEELQFYVDSEEPIPLTVILTNMVHILSETGCDSSAYSFHQAKDLLVSEYGEQVVVSD